MDEPSRGCRPSAAFVGFLGGLVGGLVVPPGGLLTGRGLVAWFSAWLATGAVLGVIIDIVIARRGRRGGPP